MTIAVIWEEDGRQWCAADTRLVAGEQDTPMTEIGSKIYSIPVAASALTADAYARAPHFRTQYGFIYAGAVLPAVMTAITASTLLQQLARPGERANPPRFEEIASFVHRLSRRFMVERRWFGSDGLFSAALFGWCPYTSRYKIAHIDGRDDCSTFRVDLSYPSAPESEGEPWLILGSAAPTFLATLADYKATEPYIRKSLPRRAIEKMVADGTDATVGGTTSIGFAHQHGFEVVFSLEPVVIGEPAARRIFNGLDLDTDVGHVGQYFVALNGQA
ncbi:MAG TPA: hypothetical protein VF138_01235 [Caulobacteraceae bacterium]